MVGNIAYVLAILALIISLIAAIRTWRTGRFSSGLHFMPTICAVVGASAGGWPWKAFFVVSSLDLGGLVWKRKFRSTMHSVCDMSPDTAPKHEFMPRCSTCGIVASTIRLFDDSGQWRLNYSGLMSGNGDGRDAISPERARAIIAGFTEPYLKQRIRSAGFYDDGGFCLQCGRFFCPAHWNISTTGGGNCPNGHFKSLDPHWSPE